MSSINFGALLSFVLITTFTPGPNNISSSSMGILYGYQRSLNYLLGIASGFFGIMLLSGLISRTLYTLFPAIEGVLRIVGTLYILWLAYKSLKTSYTFDLEKTPPLGFLNGVFLQAVNPKAWVYGLTLYTTFLASITGNWMLLVPSAILLALIAFRRSPPGPSPGRRSGGTSTKPESSASLTQYWRCCWRTLPWRCRGTSRKHEIPWHLIYFLALALSKFSFTRKTTIFLIRS